MKHTKQFLCALLSVVMLTSCASASNPISKNPINGISGADNTARDVLFAHRKKTPCVLTETANGVRYTITLDRDMYYLGDDIGLHVEITNVGEQAIPLLRMWDAPPGAAIYARLSRNGEPVSAAIMLSPTVFLGMSEVTDLLPGESATHDGLLCTSLPSIQDSGTGSLTIEFGLVTQIEEKTETGYSVFVDVPLNETLPDDYALLSYLNEGKISQALYLRARCLADNESFLITSKVSEPLEKYLPDTPAEDLHPWMETGIQFNHMNFTRVTRAQLLTMLENGYPGVLDYDGKIIADIFYSYPAVAF